MPKNSSNKSVQKVQWWRAVSRAANSVKIANLAPYGMQMAMSAASPIDQYFSRTESLIVRGTQPLLDGDSDLANLLFVGVVSQTENYFRELFANLLQVCPTSQVKSAARDMKLGSVLWHRTGLLERGAFESFSFASSDNISDTVKKYFDIQLDPKSDCAALLNEFDLLCELRHAIVHSGSVMSGKNALKLQFQTTPDNVHVQFNFNRFQEACGICTALVCSFNTELFKIFAQRWRDDWPKRVIGWTPTMSRGAFDRLWRVFYSSIDGTRGTAGISLTKIRCRNLIAKP